MLRCLLSGSLPPSPLNHYAKSATLVLAYVLNCFWFKELRTVKYSGRFFPTFCLLTPSNNASYPNFWFGLYLWYGSLVGWKSSYVTSTAHGCKHMVQHLELIEEYYCGFFYDINVLSNSHPAHLDSPRFTAFKHLSSHVMIVQTLWPKSTDGMY